MLSRLFDYLAYQPGLSVAEVIVVSMIGVSAIVIPMTILSAIIVSPIIAATVPVIDANHTAISVVMDVRAQSLAHETQRHHRPAINRVGGNIEAHALTVDFSAARADFHAHDRSTATCGNGAVEVIVVDARAKSFKNIAQGHQNSALFGDRSNLGAKGATIEDETRRVLGCCGSGQGSAERQSGNADFVDLMFHYLSPEPFGFMNHSVS
jgi:hypothetical protein